MSKVERKLNQLEDELNTSEDGLHPRLETLTGHFPEYVEDEKEDLRDPGLVENKASFEKAAWEVASYEKTGKKANRFLNKDEFELWFAIYNAGDVTEWIPLYKEAVQRGYL